MDLAHLPPLLTLITLGRTGTFLLVPARLTDGRRRADIPKSTLAQDAPKTRRA